MYKNCIKLCIIKNWINFENIRNVKIVIVFIFADKWYTALLFAFRYFLLL